jgi:mannosyltransferase
LARAREQRTITIALLIVATVGAAALRLPFLGHQSFWLDESFTLRIVQQGSLADVWSGVKATESTPPLFYVLVWAWTNLTGSDSEAALRAISAVAGIAGVPVAFFALRRLVGREIALAAAAMVAASPFLVWYSLDARSYALFGLLSLLSIWAFSAVLENPTKGRWCLWALAAIACSWTHYFAFFLVLGELCVIVWRRPALLKQALLWSVVVVVGALPALRVLDAQGGGAGRTDWIGNLRLSDRLEQLVRQFPAGPDVPWAGFEGAALLIFGVAFVGGLAIVLIPGRIDNERSLADRTVGDGPLALLVIAGVTIGVPFVLALTGIDDHFVPRNVIAVWPLLAAIAAVGLIRLKAVPLIALLAVGVVTVLATQSAWRYGKTDWRGAVREYKAHNPHGPVLVYPSLQLPTARAYLNNADLVTAPIRTREVWVIVEPARQGSRALTVVAGVPAAGTLDPRLHLAGAFHHHGFVIMRFVASRPVLVRPPT